MVGDRICQSSRLDTGAGMHDHAGRFVDNGEVFVLVNNIERDIFRLKSRDRHLDQIDLDDIAIVNFVGRFHRLFVDENVFVNDQPLQTRPRPTVDALCEIGVETLADVR